MQAHHSSKRGGKEESSTYPAYNRECEVEVLGALAGELPESEDGRQNSLSAPESQPRSAHELPSPAGILQGRGRRQREM